MIEMKNKKSKNIFYILLLLISIVMISFGFMGDDRSGNKPFHPLYKTVAVQETGKVGDAYAMNINNIYLPLNRKGIIADVNIEPPAGNGSGGQFGGNVFLFSSGFFLSGFANGQLWSNAVASASLVEDYQPGTVAGGQGDPNAVLYVLSSREDDFGQGWQDWIDAVNLGADFYDGDGDGVYTPIDKNGNGVWDPDEDRPDLIGDETVWCVYSDGIPAAQRRWNTVPPYGIEIRQTVFAFASAGAIGNLVFVRFRFNYVGTGSPDDPAKMEDVYFGVWADPDLGDYQDDVVGSDVPRNAGYTYNNTEDAQYGNQPPCFMIDFFSGPVAFIPGETFIDNDGSGDYTPGVDTPLDTAYSNRGQVLGIGEFPGAKNLPTSSFVLYINGDPNLSDPSNKEEARNYITGLDRNGNAPDPCIFPFGDVRGGVDCSTVDPKFWFSGDPVTNVGWIATINEDVRQMTNTGPFELIKGEENEITVAYVVGQGITPLNSITVARKIDDGAQIIFDLNFLAPPAPPLAELTLTSSDDFIDIVWETPEQITFFDTKDAWDLKFHSYLVYAFKTNTTSPIVGNEANIKLVASFQTDNFINSVYKKDATTGGINLLYEETDKLDSNIYSDPETGRIRVRIFNDPFNPSLPVIKGTPYYFAVVGTDINYDALVYKDDPDMPIGTVGDYYLSTEGFVQEVENVKIIHTIVVGSDANNPPVTVQPANKISGNSFGNVGYDVINNDELTTSQYEVTFFKDSSSELYQMYWDLTNITTGTLLVDSSLSYTYGIEDQVNEKVTEGFIARVEEQSASIGTPEYEGTQWFTDFYDPDVDDDNNGTGVVYIGKDIIEGRGIPTFDERCKYITADRMRRVELRFGPEGSGKAFRYINGYLSVFARNTYRYAPGITPADTVGKGVIGNWDDVNDRPNGFVDVPFTAWIVDDNFGTEQQLAVGFVERANNTVYPNGSPDGVWDPTDNLLASGEIIMIFDSPYDPNGGGNPFVPNGGGQIEFTGGAFDTPGGEEVVWADITKVSGSAKDMPDDAIGPTEEQRAIFNSPWFNTMYVVGLERKDAGSFYGEGDKLIIPVSVYPYTENDVYQFTINGTTISEEDRQELWNKVNVFPNPLYGFNTLTGFDGTAPDEPWVTFSNLPTDVTIRIYSLSGQLLRTLGTADKSEPDSPFLKWDLLNENGLRAASGLYLAVISSPKYGDKVLKFTIIMPQKQIPRF
jgi:hypothetical protein